MRRFHLISAAILLLFFFCTADQLMAQNPADQRSQADALFKQNNFNEALTLYRQLLGQAAKDKRHAQDLERAIACLQHLGRVQEADGLIEDAVAVHADDFHLLMQAGNSLASLEKFGVLIAGRFERGSHRGGGQGVLVDARDRIRSIQLYLQALAVAANAADVSSIEQADAWLRLGEAISSERHSDAWKLQDFTDLTVLPDPEPGFPWMFRGRGPGWNSKGAPVDPDGRPVFHRVPQSWQAAQSDGERWRWAMSEAARLNPIRRSEIEFSWAGFLQSQFGTGSGGAQLPPPIVPLGKEAQADADQPRQASLQNAHLLPDGETIAKLASGVKRFAVPDEFNCLVIARDIIARGDTYRVLALELLIGERMNRHQYPQAAALLREMLEFVPPQMREGVQTRIEQIEGNWLELETSRTLPAGRAATLDVRFRNGKKVTFEASRVRVDKLLADIQQYLRTAPENLDWRQTNPEDIGWRLLNDGKGEYLEPVSASWQVELTPPAGHFDARLTVESPLLKAGAWWVRAKLQDGNESRMVLWIADLAIARRHVESGTLTYVADAVTGSPVKADLELFGWKIDYRRRQGRFTETSRFADRTNDDGLCLVNPKQLTSDYQWLTIARTNDGRFAFHGMAGAWNPHEILPLTWTQVKVYTVTDRPVYRPEQTVKYRIWARRPLFEGEDRSYAERDCWIQIRNPEGEVVFEQAGRTDRWSGVDGEWTIPAGAKLGSYSLGLAEERVVPVSIEENGQVKVIQQSQRQLIGGGSFLIEEYRKPEYEVLVEAPEKPVQLGEKIPIKIAARYYFGSPVSQGRVHYKVERTKQDQRWFPAARWDWLYSPGYWWFAPTYDWYPGFSRWGCLPPVRPWWNWSPDPPELVAEGDAPINADGTFSVEIDSASALEAHGDSDHHYSITADVVDLSRRTIFGSGSVIVAREPFKVFTWTDRGHYQTEDPATLHFQARTADGLPVAASGRAVLYAVTYGDGDLPIEREVQTWDVRTDADGVGSQRLVLPQPGQYRFSVTLTDAAGHAQEGASVLFVRGRDNNGGSYRFNDLELITDRQDYQPGDVARLQINTDQPNSTVLLFIRAQDGVCPAPQVLKLQGKSTTVEIPVVAADMPNIFVEAITIADGRVHNELREIVVPPGQRVLQVAVEPDAPTHRPGEAASVRLKLTDTDGRPVTGNVAVAVYDASLEYIAQSSIPEIRSFFWDMRRSHGLGVESSLQRMGRVVYGDQEIRMQPLFGEQFGPGGPGRFGRLAPAGNAQLMLRRGGMPGAPELMMDAAAAAPMGGAPGAPMAKGQAVAEAAPGEAAPALRSEFADTAFWLASSEADASGNLELSFKVPDNLTTWNIRVWAIGDGTRVGSGTAELIARRNLIIRPQTPRFLTERDQLVLSGVVRNDLATDKSVRVVLEQDGEHLALQTAAEQTVLVPAGQELRVDWLAAAVSAGDAVIRMKAFTDDESDAVEVRVPVQVHGMLKTESFAGVIRPRDTSGRVQIQVPAARIAEQSRLEVRFSPSLAMSLVDSLPYLIEYPYGCTEQTLNRFLPAVLVQKTLLRMGVNLADVKRQRTNLDAQQTYLGRYPAHWGDPPAVQTRDLRELPAGFGRGSSTLAAWIQQKIDEDAKARRGLGSNFNPVFDETELNQIVRAGLQKLSDMQLSDGGWGWFSGFGERSSPHITAQIVHGLTIAQQNDVPVLPDVLQKGVEWLRSYQQQSLKELREGDRYREDPAYRSREPHRSSAENLDAFVAQVLTEHNASDAAMNEYLFRDRGQLSAYGLALSGLVMHQMQDLEKRDLIIRNLDQFVVQDDANQTAWLRLPENSWWYWYGSDNEAMAVFLRLRLAVNPQDELSPRLVKYLLNNRKHGSRWNSTRDTAMVLESLAGFVQVSGEAQGQMTVEVLVDGAVKKTVEITPETFFGFDNALVLTGADVTDGEHVIELRRVGGGPLYYNVYLTNFTKEEAITAAGLEVQVQRRFYRLERDDREVSVQGQRGQVVKQQTAKYRRVPVQTTDGLPSGTLVEVELVLDSKNDYEYLMLEDHKPAGFEPDDQRSGYVYESLRAYRELRDDRVTFFLGELARGQHSISYRLRAEAPGQVSALPAVIEGMYAPELVGNSDEMRLQVVER
ncbi:MAG: MG2 domain-containing protein [Planctomycetota bacterium]